MRKHVQWAWNLTGKNSLGLQLEKHEPKKMNPAVRSLSFESVSVSTTKVCSKNKINIAFNIYASELFEIKIRCIK